MKEQRVADTQTCSYTRTNRELHTHKHAVTHKQTENCTRTDMQLNINKQRIAHAQAYSYTWTNWELHTHKHAVTHEQTEHYTRTNMQLHMNKQRIDTNKQRIVRSRLHSRCVRNRWWPRHLCKHTYTPTRTHAHLHTHLWVPVMIGNAVINRTHNS